MPGSLVRDANAINLLTGATLNSAGTTNGTVQRLDKPGEVRFCLLTSTVTGTTPTISIEVKGADDLAFSTNVVSYGLFATTSGTGAAQTGISRYLDANVYKRYVRATVVLGGTSPVYTSSTL